MSVVHELTRCPQCGDDHTEFDADCSASYRMTCLVCGYFESENLKFNVDGICCGSLRVIGKGFGVLRYRCVDDNFLWNHFLRTPREAHDALRWLRSALYSSAVDADTAYLTRWSDTTNQIEVLVGDPCISSQT